MQWCSAIQCNELVCLRSDSSGLIEQWKDGQYFQLYLALPLGLGLGKFEAEITCRPVENPESTARNQQSSGSTSRDYPKIVWARLRHWVNQWLNQWVAEP